MFTNIQILTHGDEVIHAIVDPEKRIISTYQNLRKIPNALIDNFGHWVEVLDLSYNKLRDVEELSRAYRLHTLILDHNLFTSDSYFPWMPNVRVLWLNNNLILSLKDFIPALSRAFPNLQYLSLMGNAAVSSTVLGGSEIEQEKYRQYVVSYFGKLRHLDDKPVTTIERLKSNDRYSLMKTNLLSVYYDMKYIFKLNLRRPASSVV